MVAEAAKAAASAATTAAAEEHPWSGRQQSAALKMHAFAAEQAALLQAARDDAGRLTPLSELEETGRTIYGAEAAALAEGLRKAGAIGTMIDCLGSSTVELQARALSLLGNLFTNQFDRNALHWSQSRSLSKLVAWFCCKPRATQSFPSTS